MYTFK